MDGLSVDDHHQSVLHGYTQFIKYQRQQYLRSVEASVNDFINSKLLEDTYARDEVEEMLELIRTTVVNDMETELINFGQTNILMLCQMFQQAEKWHLRLNIDLSELQNKKLLEEAANLDGSSAIKLDKPRLLTPLPANLDKTSEVLRSEIAKLQEDNKQLSEDINALQDKILKIRRENEDLAMKCDEKDAVIMECRTKMEQFERSDEPNFNEKSKVASESEKILQDYEAVLKEQISKELDEMRFQVDAARSQLTLAEMELEKKFNSTAAYNNMKKIISKKNEQIKELRTRLSQYETMEEADVIE